MEAVISVLCALGGLLFGLLFLWDFTRMSGSGGTGHRGLVKAGIKLLLALFLLHFHFELDIFD